MAKFVCSFTIFIVAASVQKLTNCELFKQESKNDAKNDWRLDENQRRDQRQWVVNNKDDGASNAFSDFSKLKIKLNALEHLVQQGLPVAHKPIKISLHPSQYNDIPHRKREKPSPLDNALKGNTLFNLYLGNLGEQTMVQHLDEDSWKSRKVGLPQQLSDDMPKKIVKRLAQQETKAKKEKKLKRARVKRRRKSRKRLKYLRKIGKIPKKKGDGGLNKVKKVYKRFRKGNSTHSFRFTTTEKIIIKSETEEKSVIPRWVPDGGNSTENVASEQLGNDDVKLYDASTVENSEENREESNEESSEESSEDSSEESYEDSDNDEYYEDEDDDTSEDSNKGKNKKHKNKAKGKRHKRSLSKTINKETKIT